MCVRGLGSTGIKINVHPRGIEPVGLRRKRRRPIGLSGEGAPAEFPGPRLTLFSALRVIEGKVVEFSLNNSSLHRISRGVRFRTRN